MACANKLLAKGAGLQIVRASNKKIEVCLKKKRGYVVRKKKNPLQPSNYPEAGSRLEGVAAIRP